MPQFLAKNLSVLAYANGFTLWHYKTADDATEVDTSGYFNPASDVLRAGDMILANTGSGATAKAGMFVVATNASGSVDVADMSRFDSDNTR